MYFQWEIPDQNIVVLSLIFRTLLKRKNAGSVLSRTVQRSVQRSDAEREIHLPPKPLPPTIRQTPVLESNQQVRDNALHHDSFHAGTLGDNIRFWKSMTSDRYILRAIQGYMLEFSEDPSPLYGKQPSFQRFSQEEQFLILAEINKLLKLGVVEAAAHSNDEVVSPIFLTPKKDGSKRMILNLKELNRYMDYKHFKMENIHKVKEILYQNYFMASVDLEKAYYSVPIHPDHRRYLRFEFMGQLYQYCVLPNGISTAPYLFTKVLRVIFSALRQQGNSSIVYIDDSLLVGETYQQCLKSVHDTVDLLQKAGFFINWEKSVLKPSQTIEFLGFTLNSKTMTLSVGDAKVENLCRKTSSILSAKRPVSIREVASAIGTIISVLPAFVYGKRHYRALESCKISALKISGGDFSKPCPINKKAIWDLEYWLNNSSTDNGNSIRIIQASLEVFTDASMSMWGVSFDETTYSQQWSSSDLDYCNHHINALEALAVFYTLDKFCDTFNDKAIMVRCDNVTTVNYINEKGGHSSVICNDIACRIWDLCRSYNIVLKAAHIAGGDNSSADFLSRLDNKKNTEWSLSNAVFGKIVDCFGLPAIDLFASQHNAKCHRYISWCPDNHAIGIDAFTFEWDFQELTYAFPPFSLIGRVVMKRSAVMNPAYPVILVYPDWPCQTWYAPLQKLLRNRMVLPEQPFTRTHPLGKSLHLMCGLI